MHRLSFVGGLLVSLVLAVGCQDLPESSGPSGPEAVDKPQQHSLLNRLHEITPTEFTQYRHDPEAVARVQRMIEAQQRSRSLLRAENDPELVAIVTDETFEFTAFDANKLQGWRQCLDRIEKQLSEKPPRKRSFEVVSSFADALEGDAYTIVVRKPYMFQNTAVVEEDARIIGCCCDDSEPDGCFDSEADRCPLTAMPGVDPWFALGADTELDVWNIDFEGQGSDAQTAVFASGAAFSGHNIGFMNFDSRIPTFPYLAFSSQTTFENTTFLGNTGADVVNVNGFLEVSETNFADGLNGVEMYGPGSEFHGWSNGFTNYAFPFVFVDGGNVSIESTVFRSFETNLFFDQNGDVYFDLNILRDFDIGGVYLSDRNRSYTVSGSSFEGMTDAAWGSIGGDRHIVKYNSVEGARLGGAGYFIEETSGVRVLDNYASGASPFLAFDPLVSDAIVSDNTIDAGGALACVDPSPSNGNPYSQTSNQWCTNPTDGTSDPQFLCNQPDLDLDDQIVITPAGIQVAVFEVKGTNATNEQLPGITEETSAIFRNFDTIPVDFSSPSEVVDCSVPVAIVEPMGGPYEGQKIAILTTALTIVP